MANSTLPTNKSVQDYRTWLEGQSGKRDRREDIELTLELGNLMRSRNDPSLEDSDPEFRSQYLEASQATDRGLIGEAAAGVRRGARGLGATMVGAAALGLDAVGANETAQSVARKAKEIEEGGEDNAPTVQKIGDVTGVGSAVRYGMGKIGEAAPSIAEAIGTGLIGAGIGSAASPAGTVAGAIAGVIEKQAVKSLVKKGVKELTETAIKAEAKAIAKTLGAAAVGGANSLALSSGEIYNDTGNVGLSLGAGALAAIPDTVLPTYVLGKFFKGAASAEAKKEAGSFLAALGKEAAKTMPIEAGTEAFQELVGLAAKKYNAGEPATLTKEDISQLVEAAVGGAAGGALAAPMAAYGDRRAPTVTSVPVQQADDAKTAARKRAAAAAAGEEVPVAPAVKTRGENVRDLTRLAPDEQDARIKVLQAVTKRTVAEEGELEVLQALVGQRPPEVAKTAPAAVPVAPQPTPTPAPVAPAAVPAPVTPAPAAAEPATPTPPVTPLVPPTTPVAPVAEAKPTDVLADLTARTKQAGADISKLATTAQSLDLSAAVAQLTALADAGTATGPRSQALADLEATIANLKAQVPLEAAKLAAKQVDVATAKAKNDMAKLAAKAQKEVERALEFAEKAAKKINAPYGDLPDKLVKLGVRGSSGEVTPWEAPARKAALVVGAQIDKLNAVLAKLKTEPLSKALKKQVKPDVAKFFEAEQAKLVTQGVEAKQASAMVIETAIAEADAHLSEIYKQAGVARAVPESVVAAKQMSTLDGESPAFVPEKEVAPVAAAPVVAPTAPVQPAPALDSDAMSKALAANAPSTRTTGFSFGKVTLESKQLADGEAIDLAGSLGKDGNRANTKVAVAFAAPDGRIVMRGVTNYKTKMGLKRVGGPDTGRMLSGQGVQGMAVAKENKQKKELKVGGNEQAPFEDVVAAGYKPVAVIHFDGEGGVIAETFQTRADFEAAWGASMKGAVPINDARKKEKAMNEAKIMAGIKQGKLPVEKQLVVDAALIKAKLDRGDIPADQVDAATADMMKKLARADKLAATNQKQSGTEKLPDVERVKVDVETGGDVDPNAAAGGADADLNAEAKIPGEIEGDAQGGSIEDTPGGKLGAFFGSNDEVREEVVTRLKKFDKSTIIPGNAMPLLLSYLNKAVATPLGLEPLAVVNHITAAWTAAKSGAKTDIELFEYSLTKGDPMKIEAETYSRDANRSVPETAQARAQFDQMVNTLRNQGHDIELLKKTFIGEGGQDAWIDGDGKISLVMNDTAAGNLRNVAALMHEVGHDLIGQMSEARKAALMRATNATIDTVANGEVLTASANANTNAEEKIVDTLAIKLAEEGFGAQSATLAETIWRTVKDLYFRMANALVTSLGGNPGDQFVIAWFENSLRRKLGGDYDYRFASLLAPFTESRARTSERFTRIGGAPVADFLNPLTNRIEQGVMLPDTVEAADWNVMHAPRDFSVDDPDNAKVNLAPNGKPSKLSNRQWNMVRTDAFKAWFGDWQNDPANASKAIDPETGEPLVVYHGTSASKAVDLDALMKRRQLARNLRSDLGDFGEVLHPVTPGEGYAFKELRAWGEVTDWKGKPYAKLLDEFIAANDDSNAFSADGFEEFNAKFFREDALKGPGVYTTASAKVAGGDGTTDGYNNKGGTDGAFGRVIPLFMNIKTPMMDEPANLAGVVKQVDTFLRSLPVEDVASGGDGRVRKEIVFTDSEGNRVLLDPDLLGEDSIDEGAEFSHPTPYKHLSELDVFDGDKSLLSDVLKALGYDGIQHTGGLSRRHGDGVPHQVFVAFDPTQVKSTLNLGTFNPADARIQYSKDGTPTSPTESDLNYTEAASRITSAAWNEIIPIIEELKKTLGKDFTDTQFWARFANGDLPRTILDRMESRAPGSSAARISDATMTDPMVQRARYIAYKLAETMARRALGKAAKLTEHADAAGLELIEQAKKLNKIERESRDASAVNAHFNEKLRNDLKELVRDLDRGYGLSESAGKLLGAIRVEEGLADDQAIPEEYSRVFKTILDSDGTTSLFDKLEAISKLNLPLGGMNVDAVIAAIKENAPKDANLAKLVANRPLLVALASLARNSTREMDLLQLRTLKDTTQYLAIKAQLEEIRTANDERLDQLTKDFKTGQENQGLSERLRGEFLKARREFRTTQRTIQRSEETAAINRQVAAKMEAKATDLSKEVGAFSSWVAHDGATYSAMQPKDDGKTWVAVTRTLRMVGDDVGAQREQIRHDLALNMLWLEGHADQRGSRLYQEIERQTHELGVTGIGEKEYRAANRWKLDKLLQPLGQKFASTGRAAGTLIQQMLNRWQFVTKTHADEIEAKSRKWTYAFEEARNAAGYTGARARQFAQEIYTPVIYAIESQPGMDWTTVMREAVRAAKRRIPEGFVVTDAFAEKLGNLMRATDAMSSRLNGIAEEQGVYITDKRLKDPLTAKANLQRHAIKYGVLTSTRRLDANVIRTLVKNMTAVGWHKGMFDAIVPGETTDAQWRELIDKHFTPIVKRTFVDPFTGKPGKEVFVGAKLANGDAAYVSQLMARNEWENAGGDVLTFIDNLFDKTNEADNRDGLNDYRKTMLKRFAFLYEMESTLAAKTDLTQDVSNPTGPKSHRIMDGRTNDLIPPEHFSYDLFDPASTRIALAEIAYHAAFGRDGTGLDKAIATLKTDLGRDADSFSDLKGSEKMKREKAAAAGLDYKKIERAYKDSRNVDGWMGEIVAYFGGTNPSGATGDARTALELLQLNTQLVLNQPKSGLWNILSLADFPVAFRGINKSSLTATGFATRALAKNVFGSLLETMGIQVLRSSEYAKEIGQVFESRQTERLPYGVFMADIGKGGSFEDTKGDRVTQGIRAIQQTMRKGVKLGVKGEGEFAGNNALWAPFNYINTQVASALATANVQTFEIMMKKAVAYYAAHPEAHGNPNFKFTAELLGMKGNAFFSDEGAFDFYRRASLEYRMGSLEEMARGAAGRLAKGERILTRDQVLSIALIANNELSLESSINSRPSEMFNSQVLRFGGMLMGWPLAKMNQVNQSLKTSDGRIEAMSVLKGLGVMAAWSLPIGLAYSLLMDRYDDDILNKKSNLRAIDPIAAVPIVGPALALMGAGERTAGSNALGMLERMAKAGTYGMMGDFVNSMANWVDPTSGQREFDLNSRVVAYSQYANIRDTIRNLIHQDGAVTYSTVVRPLLTSLGGNGIIQYQQILNNALGLSNAESELTNRINVRSYIRAAAREVDISLKAGGARTSPTPTSVWVREMELNALSNDRLGFLDAYRNAVDAARKAGEAEPEGKILEAWKARGPIKSVTAHVPSETEMTKLNAALGEDGRRVVREAEGLFARYTESIAPSPFEVMMQRQARAQTRAMDPEYQAKLRAAAAQRMGIPR